MTKTRLLLLLLFFCACTVAQAQMQNSIFGHVYERGTQQPIPGVKVTNTVSNEVTVSDTTGAYQVKAKIGDKLIFEGFAYKTDTVYVLRLQQTTVFLTPKINELAEVKVGQQINTSGWVWRSGRRARKQKAINPTGKIPNGFIKNPFKKKKRDARNQKKWEIEAEIDRRFAPFNVGYFVPLKEQVLRDFCDLYKPTVAQYISPQFDFILYLNDSYKAFLKLPPEKRKLPPLVP